MRCGVMIEAPSDIRFGKQHRATLRRAAITSQVMELRFALA
jgi:hypothetical protein